MLLLQTAFEQEFAAVQAACVADSNCHVMMTGIGPKAARQSLTAAFDEAPALPRAVLSIGLAGALLPDTTWYSAFLIESVSMEGKASLTANLELLSTNLRRRMSVHKLVTLSRPALTAEVKRDLAEQTGAGLCDMETYAIADVCSQHGVPWLGLRVVSDRADENLPAWTVALPQLIARKRWLKVAGSLATHPQDIPQLIRLGRRMQLLKPLLTKLTIDLVTNVLPPAAER